MRSLKYSTLFLTALAIIFLFSCHSDTTKPVDKNQDNKNTYVYRETIVDKKNSDMVVLSGFKRVDYTDVLCQYWELKDMEDASTHRLMWVNGNGDRLYQELILFKDSSVIKNPRNGMRIGKWTATRDGNDIRLSLVFPQGLREEYLVSDLSSAKMKLNWKNDSEQMYMRMRADARVHRNMLNDPFHPTNINWCVPPTRAETDSAIKARVRACVKFYALYFRDNVLRKKDRINFAGLPSMFNWYSGGLGLPDPELVDDSWINCFYNEEQAMKGYEILKKLIVQHEFNWPRRAPSWVHQTHSVLEQMYHELGTK
jgi:hypothetical protein